MGSQTHNRIQVMNLISNRNPEESVDTQTTGMRNLIDQVLQSYLCYKTDVNCRLTQRTIFRGFSNYNGIL